MTDSSFTPGSTRPETAVPSDQSKAVRVTLIGSAIDLALGILKIIIGLLANSLALVSDGVHSLSDLITDVFVLVLARIAHQAPDAEHPYGHRRFETIGTVIISVGLFIVAGIICFDSITQFGQAEDLPAPGWLALMVTVISIGSKEWIYRYTRQVAREIGSSMLLANAWHSRTDALSSIVVLVGIIGVWWGIEWMDLAAALVVGLMIARIAWTLIIKSLAELVDTGLPGKQLEEIRYFITHSPGIKGVHDLRSRLHGEKAFLDIHVQVSSRISVSEGHFLGDRLSQSLKDTFPVVSDIIVHIDPELDLDSDDPSLPDRSEVESTLLQAWQGLLDPGDVKGFVLHYLNNQLEVEVKIDISIINSELRERVKASSNHIPWLRSLSITGVF